MPGLGEIELATAMVFDLGVYGTVTGTTLLIVSHLGVRNTPAAFGRPRRGKDGA